MHRLMVPVLLCATFSTSVLAQPYPSKSVRMLVSDSAGGLSDTIARVVASGMSEVIGQRVIIENRAGAASNIGAAVAAKSPPDGYTLYQMPQTLTVNATLYSNLQYDLLRDFMPVTRLGGSPALVTVHPSLPVRTLADLVKLAKAQPQRITFASAGTGAPTFLAAELFKKFAAIDLMHVPYRGGGEAITAAITGETPVYFAPLTVAWPHVQSGRLRGLAVTSSARVPAAPQMPTVAELGYPGYESGFWYGLVLPAKSPREVFSVIHAATLKTLKLPDVSKRMQDMAFTTVGDSPEEFTEFIKAEIEKWGRIIRELGLKAN